MARKQKKAVPKRPVTKRQRSQWQRQRRTRRIILSVGACIIALVVGIIGYGYYSNEVKPSHQTAIRVNGTTFNMDYYVNMLHIYAKSQTGLSSTVLADYTVRVIQQDELLRQGALELGIEVDAEEIDKELDDYGLPNDKEYRDLVEAELLREKLGEEYFEAGVPLVAPHVYALAMVLESEEAAGEIKARIEAGGNFTALAQELSQEPISKTKSGDLGWLPEGYALLWLHSSVFDEVAFALEPGVLSEPAYDEAVEVQDEAEESSGGYWLIKVLERDNERVVEAEQREEMKMMAFDNWFWQLWEDSEDVIEDYLDEQGKAWALDRVFG